MDKDKAAAVLARAASEGRSELVEQEAREIASAYGLRLPRSELAKSATEAVAEAEDIGFPVVLKVASPDILHKSDVGGVKVNLGNPQEVRRAYRDIIGGVGQRMPHAAVDGVLVQEMVSGGREVILGMSRDPQFGPMFMFGLGGIYVEVLKDVSFRLAPLTKTDADEMIREIRSYGLLRGVRGEKPADVSAVADCLLRLAQLVNDFPQIMELDVNPLSVFEKGKGAVAIDARLTVALNQETPA